ncbi:hypothetical protein [Paracoccus zhejiangensis]|uniref:Uncharacterized protein n=1 Tax=Paracoccus zhejiangensis TaxID=1077935 RepID=A0A2H5EWL5_9RHOB|nr:hypothetical protein [Paracoccus zhejiangensis]AUH63691.1 hypothetical protein CX676_05555 [Paracoccus zhejiangensis]
MSFRATFAALLLAGCAAAPGATVAPVGNVPIAAGQGQAQASYASQRAGLRRIGYRNCDGYAIELFAPARISAASASGQSLFLRAYAYRGGGPIRLSLPGAASRLQQQTASGWQELPRQSALAGSSVTGSTSGAIASASLPQQLGFVEPMNPGHYRAWLGQFSATRAGGASCAITPVWQFDIS